MFFATTLVTVALALSSPIVAQLSGPVGPLTSRQSKAANKTCNVLDYGGVADGVTDIGPAINSAFNDCMIGGLVYIPPGNYSMATWVTLNNGRQWALQLDGIISRNLNATQGGTMIYVENSQDFEMFSSTSKGAIQGNGYVFHAVGDITTGPRILRLGVVTDFSVHDLALVDSPVFHMDVAACYNGEVYNMIVRGGNEGGLDGFDVWGSNIWVHDVSVTNKDECVTIKNPSNNILVEDIYCNWSGGCAIGSLGSNTNITDILYQRVYTWEANQMMMIKSNGGNGTLTNVLFKNFIGHGNAYSLNVDQYWSPEAPVPGPGVQLYNITFQNWKGTEADGALRGPVRVVCADGAPCQKLTIEGLSMWTETGDTQWYDCRSAYGSGYCLRTPNITVTNVTEIITSVKGNGKTVYKTKTTLSTSSLFESYAASTTTVSVAPANYKTAYMSDDLTAAFGTNMSIPIPTIPTSFFPGQTPISPLLGNVVTSTA